jgi:hypothetical protein
MFILKEKAKWAIKNALGRSDIITFPGCGPFEAGVIALTRPWP